MHTTTFDISDQPILSDDQRSLMRLAREAQTGNLVAALSLTPLIERLTAHLEDPMQQRTLDPPADPDPLPDDAPGGDDPETGPYAVTRLSLAIDARMKRCRICDGPHFSWRCPAIAEVQGVAPYDTQDIIDLWATNRTLLAARLARLTETQLMCQALSFAAWLQERTASGLSAETVLHIWQQMIAETHLPGPAAPAMRRAA